MKHVAASALLLFATAACSGSGPGAVSPRKALMYEMPGTPVLTYVAEGAQDVVVDAGAMGTMEIRRYCREFPRQILFRGHSHSPEIAWMEGHRVKVESLTPGARLDLAKRIPCVVTCGALTRGLCMVWDPNENFIKSLSFRRNPVRQ